ERAHHELIIGLEQHQRARRQRVAFAAGVLDQVLGQLVAHLGLVGRELLAVGRVQVQRVLVGDVHAVDGDRLVVVHLLGQLARQLDRLHGGAKGAREHALEEAADLLLDGTKHAHISADWSGSWRDTAAAAADYRPDRIRGAASAEAAGSIATSAAAAAAGATASGWLVSAAGSATVPRAKPSPHSVSACIRRDPARPQATGSIKAKPIIP